ncbi:hypothetical protein VTO42DRAFT_4832 [Malbranchea cinnamomea]
MYIDGIVALSIVGMSAVMEGSHDDDKPGLVDHWLEERSAATSVATNTQGRQSSRKRASLSPHISPSPAKRHEICMEKSGLAQVTETETDVTFASSSSSMHISTRVQRQNLRGAEPSIQFLPLELEGGVMPEEIAEFYSGILDRLESAIPKSLMYGRVSQLVVAPGADFFHPQITYRPFPRAHEL